MNGVKWTLILIAVYMVLSWIGEQRHSVCEWCHEEFKGNTPYCSQRCYNAAVAYGYENPYEDEYIEDYIPGPY